MAGAATDSGWVDVFPIGIGDPQPQTATGGSCERLSNPSAAVAERTLGGDAAHMPRPTSVVSELEFDSELAWLDELVGEIGGRGVSRAPCERSNDPERSITGMHPSRRGGRRRRANKSFLEHMAFHGSSAPAAFVALWVLFQAFGFDVLAMPGPFGVSSLLVTVLVSLALSSSLLAALACTVDAQQARRPARGLRKTVRIGKRKRSKVRRPVAPWLHGGLVPADPPSNL